MSSLCPLSRLLDHFGDTIQFLLRQLRSLHTEQRRDNVFSRPVVKSVDELFQRGLSDFVFRDCRKVDVPEVLFLMPHVTLTFEDSQLSANRRIVRLSGKIVHDLSGRRAFKPVKDVHDFALSWGQRGLAWLLHCANHYNRMLLYITHGAVLSKHFLSSD